MNSKLTLKLDNNVIEQAKNYAKANNISLSKLIENYLQAVTLRKRNKVRISPLVESLTGVIELNERDYKKSYTDFLSEKYL
jgi:antitoxin component of RelBE/YafQ-DinJ toxin-antitoxin module